MLSFHCLAFLYGGAKTIRIQYVWTRFFFLFENGGKKSPFYKISGYVWTGLHMGDSESFKL